MSIFKKLDVANKVKKSEKGQSDFDGNIKFLELQDGKNRIRLLPPTNAYPDYEFKTYRHYKVGPDGKSSVLCPKRTYPEMKFKCPICEASSELYASKDKESAKALFASERNYANVLNLDEDAEPKNVYILSYGYKISNTFVKKISDSDYGDITDLETGFNITIEKEKNKGGLTEYTVDCKKQCQAPEFDETQVTALNKMYKTVLSYNALKAILEGESIDAAGKEYGHINVETGEMISGNPENPDESVIEEKPKAKKVIDDTDDEPIKKPMKKAIIDEDDEPVKPMKKPVVQDDDEMPMKKAIIDEDDEPVKPMKKPVIQDDDDDDDLMAELQRRKASKTAKK